MKKINGVIIEDITEKNIVSEPVLKKIESYKDNAKLWKASFTCFLVALVVNLIASTLFSDRFPEGFDKTRMGVFLISLMTICFITFGFFLIREKRFCKKKWHCPLCKESFPYYVTEKECRGKGFIMDCNTLGLRLARNEETPFVMPNRCPNCHEKIWKELSNGK